MKKEGKRFKKMQTSRDIQSNFDMIRKLHDVQ